METRIEEFLICELKLATFERTTHVSLSQRVAITAELPTRTAADVALLLPYARPNTVMAVLPLCGTVFGSTLLTAGRAAIIPLLVGTERIIS